MMHRALPWLLPLVLVACGDDSAPAGDESSTGTSASTGSPTSSSTMQATLSGSQSESESESDTTSGTGTTDDPTSGTSTGEPSTGETATTGETDASTGSTGTGSTGEPDTTGTLVCDIVDVVEQAAVGKRDPEDCGVVTLADPLGAWQAAHDCVLENYEAQSAFTVVGELPGIDSEVFIGYAGMVGESYVASQYFSDNYMGTTTIYETTPCNIGVIEDCSVAVGELCLECVGAGESQEFCQG